MTLSTRPEDLAIELQRLTDEVHTLDGILAGWTQSGNTYIDVPFLKADRGEFMHPPFPLAELTRETTQFVTTNAWNTIAFDRIIQNPGVVNYSTASTGNIGFYTPPNRHVFLVFGRVVWGWEDGTYRSIKIESYPTTQEVLMAQNSISEIVQQFATFYTPPDGTTGCAIQIFEKTYNIPISSASVAIWDLGVTR